MQFREEYGSGTENYHLRLGRKKDFRQHFYTCAFVLGKISQSYDKMTKHVY